MPNKASRLLDMLGVDENSRTFAHARPGRDSEYGTSKVPLGKGTQGVLFPPLTSDL
jgi:methionyl-tRNA synthetase